MASGFTSASGFAQSSFFDDSQLTYSNQYFTYLRDIDLPFNMDVQQMFEIGTSGFLRQQLQWEKQAASMFAPTPYGN